MTSKHRTVLNLLMLVCAMLALSFASVPLYDWFCRVTGYGGTTQAAYAESDVVLDQVIKVRFDGSLTDGMQWDFKPVVRTMVLKIGETGLAFYEAHNPTSRPIAGTANFNVFPFAAGSYFSKIDCFCFELQVLQPGETVQMPVTFFVDPEIREDAEARSIKAITLSYTFYETNVPGEQASLSRPETNRRR
ncbi:MAG: cytochrome c oxidase assembly protein [Rhodobacteraceae bacterium]|nr:cytochrome c oxidase assembly protein [Paracoccaceae bacterium]